MRCKHCGVRIARTYYGLDYLPKFVHVTANGDHRSAYCEVQLAEPTDEQGD